MSISFLILFEFLGAIQKSITLLCYFFNLISQKRFSDLKVVPLLKSFLVPYQFVSQKQSLRALKIPSPTADLRSVFYLSQSSMLKVISLCLFIHAL